MDRPVYVCWYVKLKRAREGGKEEWIVQMSSTSSPQPCEKIRVSFFFLVAWILSFFPSLFVVKGRGARRGFMSGFG